MKRPYLQFYTGDWQSNPKLRCCSHAEKGIWIDVICILHDQDEYGILRWPLKQLAQAVHTSVSSLKKLVDMGILRGADTGATCDAFVYTPRSGRKEGKPITLVEAQPGPVWYSSRMVRDEYVRSVRSDNEPKAKDPPFGAGKKPPPKVGLGADKNLAPNLASSRALASISDSDPISTSDLGSSSLPLNNSVASEKKETLPKNGSGETPSKNPAQIQDFTIWNLGVEKLRAAGMSDRSARSFLGKQIHDYTKSTVARAVTEMLAQDPVEPCEYLVAVLQTGSGERFQKSRVDHSLDSVRRVIAQKEAQLDAASR